MEMVQETVYACHFGRMYMAYEYEDGVLYRLCSVVEGSPLDNEISRNAEKYERGRSAFSDRVYIELAEYFDGKRKAFDIPYVLHGTAFQLAVWQELAKIPYGTTTSYQDIARAIGRPRATRAVGNANNKNPLQFILPCHRVIGKDGSLVGYAGGLTMKEALLLLEREVVAKEGRG